MAGRHIALFVRSFGGSGGAELVMLKLAQGLVDLGHRVDLVMARKEGHFLDRIPPAVRVVDLRVRFAGQALAALPRLPDEALPLARMALGRKPHFVLGALPGLARYLARERPDGLISALDYPNVVALLARKLAGVSLPVIVTAHSTLSVEAANAPASKRSRIRAQLWVDRRFYPAADAIVAVSEGVAEDLAAALELPRGRIRTIYNPVVDEELCALAAEPLDHPWFASGQPPVFLAVGGLKPAKDLPNLLRAFARVRAERQARLVILGEGRDRAALEQLALALGVAGDLEMPGFVANPFRYMRRADQLVLSSAWEGLPTVLIQALACGCPVVSTDCPSGPAEILAGGRFGRLVPPGDDQALAQAMLATLATPPDRDLLIARGSRFSVEAAARAYQDLITGTDGSPSDPART